MKFTIQTDIEVDVDTVRCELAVNYCEEDMPNNYPHRKGDMWTVDIDVATGQILDWPTGVEARDLYMKVCDSGSYYLIAGGKIVAKIEQDYVPNCIPGEYGDYVDFKIDHSGKITNWSFDADDTDQFEFVGTVKC